MPRHRINRCITRSDSITRKDTARLLAENLEFNLMEDLSVVDRVLGLKVVDRVAVLIIVSLCDLLARKHGGFKRIERMFETIVTTQSYQDRAFTERCNGWFPDETASGPERTPSKPPAGKAAQKGQEAA